ncbi:MAG TPA: DUF2917 domain-containing protein [Trinickia sp.]|nr:DUF2917 domain-containing protein [Trinickia sp.]
MREISSSITFEIVPGETVPMTIVHSTRLTVQNGPVWVTRSNDVEDYWLAPGRALHLRRGERLWLSVEGARPARIAFLAPMPHRILLRDLFVSLAERLSMRWRNGLRTV